MDLAIVDCVSQTTNYRNSEASLNPEVLLKKREGKKKSKYRTLVERNGGQFEPLVISTSGRITANTRKLLFLMLFVKNHQEIMLELDPTALYINIGCLESLSS